MTRLRAARSPYSLLGILIFCLFCGQGAGAEDAAGAEARESAYAGVGADTCLGCHNDEKMLLIFRTPHGQGADPNTPMAHLQCESCHVGGAEHSGRRNIGAGHPAIVNFGRGSETPIEQQNGICMGCHTRHVGMAWTGSVHERNQVLCGDCHNPHEPVDRVSLLTEQADVCYECHKQVRAQSLKPYAHPIRQGILACTACHNPHHSVNDALLVRNNVTELCWSCHSELRGPYLWEHAPVTEDCSLCHYAHGSIHPAMLVKRPPLLCQSCHSQAGHPSLSLTPGGLPGGGGSPSAFLLNGSCLNCHSQVHGSNHPSGSQLMR
jgi:DmsE family decaheme c-type cytochrome